MHKLKRIHKKLSALLDAGHGKNHPEILNLLERLESLREAEGGKPIIKEKDRKIHYGSC